MEETFLHILKIFLGSTPAAGCVLAFVAAALKSNAKKAAEIIRLQDEATEQRKTARDKEISDLNAKIDHHIGQHQIFENKISKQLDGIYERLNPIVDKVNKIDGFIDGQRRRE